MSKDSRERIINNNKCMDILTKEKGELTQEERLFLKRIIQGGVLFWAMLWDLHSFLPLTMFVNL